MRRYARWPTLRAAWDPGSWGHVQVVEPPHRGNPIYRAIADNFNLAADLLVRFHESFVKHRPNPNSMLSRMLKDSEVLYDRRAP